MEYTWKDIKDHPRFEVSSCGAVRRKIDGKLIPISLNNSGYAKVSMDKDNCFCHTLVLEAFIGPRPEGFQADHIDNNRINNSVENLRWVSKSINNRTSGRIVRVNLAEIRKLLLEGLTQREIANKLGCSKGIISYHFKYLKLPNRRCSELYKANSM
jgi:hypothetical protein